MDMLEAAVKIRDEGFKPEIPADMPEWLQQLVSRCLQKNPDNRVKMADVTKTFRVKRAARNSTVAVKQNVQNTSAQSAASNTSD